MSKIATKWIADDAVTAAKLNSDTAGLGITQGGGGALDVNVDDSTIEVSVDTVQVKDLGISTGKLAATSVTAAKLGADVAGDGLTGGNGADLDVDPDTTGGANLARAINVSANGVAVKINDTTIGEDGSQRLEVKANSIDATHVDETDDYTWTGTHDLTSGTTHVATPSSDTHAVTKAYADGLRQGVAFKDQCRALADSNQTLSGLPGTIDGVGSWSAGQRILLTNQTSGDENGIWEVQTTAWTRPSDFDTGDSASGAQTWIDQGTSYGETQWACTTDAPNDVIDTNSLAFVQTSGAGQITAGVGMTKSGNTLHVGGGATGNSQGINFLADDIEAAYDDSTINLSGEVLQVKDLGIATGKIAATAVTAAKLGADVAGNGLGGGNGSAIVAVDDPTGGANLSKSVNVSANGLAVKIDDSTIGEGASSRLEVKNDGITAAKLNSDTAGDGILQEGSGALAMDINGLANTETVADNADLIAVYDQTDGRVEKMTRANFLSGVGGGNTRTMEAHKITAGEVTNGYFTLANSPATAGEVSCTPVGGPEQMNKQIVGATGVTPDFDILSTNQLHFNNNGAATGLSAELAQDDVVIVEYSY
jgi:hypothetical protein